MTAAQHELVLYSRDEHVVTITRVFGFTPPLPVSLIAVCLAIVALYTGTTELAKIRYLAARTRAVP